MLSASKKLKSESFFELALKAKKEERYGDYVSILKEGSKNNDSECIYYLGICYFEGWYGKEMNDKKAFKLFRKNKNHFKSMAHVVCMLKNGIGCSRNEVEGEELQLKILNSIGNHFAKGRCLFYQSGTAEAAFEEFLIAAKEGDEIAQWFVACRFKLNYKMDSKITDKTEAHKWFLKSAEQGYPKSQCRMARLFFLY
jgi:TPR repeat protein